MTKRPRTPIPPRVRNAAYDRIADQSRTMRIEQIEREGLDEARRHLETGNVLHAVTVLQVTANWADRYRKGAVTR